MKRAVDVDVDIDDDNVVEVDDAVNKTGEVVDVVVHDAANL